MLHLLKRLLRREYVSSEKLAEVIFRELNHSGYARVWFATVEVAEEIFSILPSGSFEIYKIEIGPDRVDVDFLLPSFDLAA